jgi:hypothetical protein
MNLHRWLKVCLTVLCAAAASAAGTGAALAAGAVQTIDFNGFAEGELMRDQYLSRGLRIPPDPNGGPWIDDGAILGFLLETPPNLLTLNVYGAGGGPGQVHASVGTYQFEFVDPQDPNQPGVTDYVTATVVFVDKGRAIMTGWNSAGDIVDQDTLDQPAFSYDLFRMTINGPGIRRVTLDTPMGNPTLGMVLDTLAYGEPGRVNARQIQIDVMPDSQFNILNMNQPGRISVLIYADQTFNSSIVNAATVRFQGAKPVGSLRRDFNGDGMRDLWVVFRVADLQGLVPGRQEVRLTTVGLEGQPLEGIDTLTVIDPSTSLPRRQTIQLGAPAPPRIPSRSAPN